MSTVNTALLSGPVPFVLRWCGLVTLAWLVGHTMRARRRGWAVTTLGCAAVAVALTVLGQHLVRNVWRLFPDPLTTPVFASVALPFFALALAAVLVTGKIRLGHIGQIVVAVLVVVAANANEINRYFAAYPTLADAIGADNSGKIPFQELTAAVALAPDEHPLSTLWTPRTAPPDRGSLTSAPIPATHSGFTARPAEIYLPPAYFVTPRPQLPVLVLLSGQPGSPQDWLAAGRLARTMDSFAAAHGGLAPITVVADGTGDQFANPLCLDSHIAKSATYLAIDVPAWIRAHLTVDPDPDSWAIGGLSYGGTCALQLATNYPAVYPTFLSLSADTEPTLGSRGETITRAFAGNEHAYQQVSPTHLLRTRRYPDSAGALVTGNRDRDGRTAARTLLQATRAAGMNTHYTELPGGHDWHVWSAALYHELPWLAVRLGLVP